MGKLFDFFFYTEQRVGKGGKLFTLYKFRTIKRGEPEPEDQKISEIFRTYENDSRVTLIGGFLKRTHLDDLPQLFYNVIIKRNMDLVGPRPPIPEEEDKLPEEEVTLRREVNPGCFNPPRAIMGGDWSDKARRMADMKYLRDRKRYYRPRLDLDIILRNLYNIPFGKQKF